MQVINESAHLRTHRYYLTLRLLQYFNAFRERNGSVTFSKSDWTSYPIINTADDGKLNNLLAQVKLAIEDIWFLTPNGQGKIKMQVETQGDTTIRWFTFIEEAKVSLQAKQINKTNFDIPYTTVKLGLVKDRLLICQTQQGISSCFSFSLTDLTPAASVEINQSNLTVSDFPSGHSSYVR